MSMAPCSPLPLRLPGRLHARAASAAAAGLTLIELMVTIAVAAILMATAIPSFQAMIQRNRVITEANSLVSDLQFARSEAIRQGLPVSLCVSADGRTCLGANTWHSGWIVFVDTAASGSIASGVTPLRKRDAFVGGDTFVADSGASALTYSRDGFAINMPAGGTTLVLHTSPVNAAATRCVALGLTGHQTGQSPGTGNCT
ncbi:MAG: GspH/FimT family pseudopilin [Burkholderiales bacterium]|nr:GspH/FimT family pseudopilin [Burkholderiales bacterium]MDE2276782.1 GspH/FimT family pseudopilin [Burkholderiales bacterium]